ncbi:MAG TPA: hypothetical protein VG986_05675 [Pseudolabrys sp.]|nr:hypothetical protein [Pseudolabrys sp.]
MTKATWIALTAGAALLAAAVYGQAQPMPGAGGPMGAHDPAMMHMHGHAAGPGPQVAVAAMPTAPGQDAFGAIQEIVQILEADPTTDWSKVNIEALRQHLIDMNEVTLNAAVAPRVTEAGIEFDVTGAGRTRDAIKRMVPAHVHELAQLGWNASTVELPNGVRLVVNTNDPRALIKLKALGFIGIMVQGSHHQPHHLMMAKGEFAH